jgi:hypothetical protein
MCATEVGEEQWRTMTGKVELGVKRREICANSFPFIADTAGERKRTRRDVIECENEAPYMAKREDEASPTASVPRSVRCLSKSDEED